MEEGKNMIWKPKKEMLRIFVVLKIVLLDRECAFGKSFLHHANNLCLIIFINHEIAKSRIK